jgi:hypothetical protein
MDGEGFVDKDACSDGRSDCPDDADEGNCVVVVAAAVLLVLLLLLLPLLSSEIISCTLKRDLQLPLTITTYH